MRASTQRSERGFTMLELIIAMAIFTLLGTMVIMMMRQSLDIFYQGIKEDALFNRMDTALPVVAEDIESIYIGDEFDPPPPPLTEEQRLELDRMGQKERPRGKPSVVRMRSGTIILQQQPEGPLKDYPMRWFALIADRTGRVDPILVKAGNYAGPEAVDYTPKTAKAYQLDRSIRFKATGGLMEVCYIAVPDERFPELLSLYRGYRAPIGDPKHSLLIPENLDTIEEIKERCTLVARGLLYFNVTWRRIHATSWEEDATAVGQDAPYVGSIWDSTRAIDKTFPLYAGADSLVDPSDDVFPGFVRLQLSLSPGGNAGYGKGELTLESGIGPDDTELSVSDPQKLLQGRGNERYLKIGTEWMSYGPRDVNTQKKTVRVDRGARGTTKQSHDAGWIHVGMDAAQEIKMPVYRDSYTVGVGEKGP